MADPAAPPPPPAVHLTEAELRIVTEYARGATATDISRRWYVNVATVKTHQRRIAPRLGCCAAAPALIAACYRAGLLDGLEVEPRPVVTLSRRQRLILIGWTKGLTIDQSWRHAQLPRDKLNGACRELLAHLDARTKAHAVALAYQHGHLPARTGRRPEPPGSTS